MEALGGDDEVGTSLKMTKVSVAVRVRPLIDRERKADAQLLWQIGPKELRPYDPEAKRVVPNSETYTYDHVFDPSTQTQQVYEKVVSPIVMKAFKGFNGTILCYGQTSSGKTHTLYGSNEDKGIILLFANQLFQQIKADESRRQYIIKVGLIEIYNEKVTDLLNSCNPIELKERDGSIIPQGLEELTVFDIDDWKKVTERVQRERKIGETRMNKESSRSHTILRVTIESFDLASNSNPTFTEQDPDNDNSEQSPPLTTAVLHFVDLAGSEKQSQTGAEGERFREQVNINMSLSVLSHVIQQLSENASVSDTFNGKTSAPDNYLTKAMCNSMSRNQPKSRFINFRDSKLTRLLQSSLNGDAYISMVCNVTIASFEETKSTLLFAKQAKKIQIRPKQNLCSTKSEYEKKLLELQELLNSKDKEVLVLRRQCENMKRVFEFREEQSNQRAPNMDRRLSLCPSLFRPSSIRNRHSTPEPPMSTFSYYKNKYSSSKSLHTEGEEFFSAEDFVRTLRSPLSSIRESTDVIRFDKEVQTDAGSEEAIKSLSSLTPIPKSDVEGVQHDQAVRIKKLEIPRTTGLLGTPVSTLRLNNVLLRTKLEDNELEWRDQKVFLELENKTLKEEAEIVPKLKEEIETLKLEKMELENDVMRQMQASRVEISRRLAESPEVIDLQKKFAEIEAQAVTKDEQIKLLSTELDCVKTSQKTKDQELGPKLIQLQKSIDHLLLERDDLKEKLSRQTEICDEKMKEIKELQAKIESINHVTEQQRQESVIVVQKMEADLSQCKETIRQLNIIVDEHEDCKELAANLQLAQHQANKLMADKFALDEELTVQRNVNEKAELTVQKREEEIVSLKQKMEVDIQNILVENNEKIMQLNMQVAEHEGCKELASNLKLAQNQLDQLLADKISIDEELKAEKELKKMAELTVQKSEEEIVSLKQKMEVDIQNILDENNEKIMQLTIKVAEHEGCKELVANLKLTQNQLDQLLADKHALEEEMKAEREFNTKTQLTVQNSEQEIVSLKQKMEAEIQNILDENNEKIMQLNMQVAEHEGCKELASNLKLAQNQLDQLLADKISIDEELKTEKELKKMAELTVQKSEEEIVSLKQKMEVDIQNILDENNEKIMQLNMQVAEHEGCKELASNLKLAQNQLDQLLADKLALEEEMKAEREFNTKTQLTVQNSEKELVSLKQKMEADIQNILDENNEKIMQLNLRVAEHETCKEVVANLKLAQNQLDQLLVEKLALDEELKAQKDFNAKTHKTEEDFVSLKQKMEADIQNLLVENNEKIMQLRMQVAEHEGCKELVANMKLAQNQLDHLLADKLALDEELKTEKELNKMAELTVQMREEEIASLKQKIETDFQKILVENSEKIMQLSMQVTEHEGCKELAANLKLAQNELDQLLVDKVTLDEQLKTEKEFKKMAELTVQMREEEIVSLKQKMEADIQNILDKNNEIIMQLNMKVEEHEGCKELVANLKLAQHQLDQLLVDKVKLDEQLKTEKELKKMAELTVKMREEEIVSLKQKMEAENQNNLVENNEKILQLSMLVAEHEGCKELVANLKLAQNQLEQLVADKLALDKELKAEKELNKMSELIVQKREREYVSLKQKMEVDIQNILVENNEKIMKLNMQVAEHEGCKEVVANLKLAQIQLDQLLDEKVKLDEQLKTERDFNAKTRLGFQKTEQEFVFLKQKMETDLSECKQRIRQLDIIIAEHEGCEELAGNLKRAQDKINKLMADKVTLDEELRVQKHVVQNAKLTVKKSEEDFVSLKQKMEADIRNILVENNKKIMLLNMQVAEHEGCKELASNLKLAQGQVVQLMADKHRELEAIRYQKDQAEFELRNAQDQLKKLLCHHENCDDMLTQLNTARNHAETLKASKVTLNQQLKVQKGEFEKVMSEYDGLKMELARIKNLNPDEPRCFVTRATQCDELQIDKLKEAASHYRKRAHNSEFQLQQTGKALEALKQEHHALLYGTGLPPQQVEVPVDPKLPMVNSETQCTLMNELLIKASGQDGPVLDGFPELLKLQSHLKTVEAERARLKLDLKKCNCRSKTLSMSGPFAKLAECAGSKYNTPNGFQRSRNFFQGSSSLLNTKESQLKITHKQEEHKPAQISSMEVKDSKVGHQPVDSEDIENASEKVPSAVDVVPDEEEEEPYDDNWLLHLVQKRL